MKLVFLTQYFPPEIGAAQTRIFELAYRLHKHGYEIYVLTTMPNYPTGKIFSEYQGKIIVREKYHGLNIIRSWIYPTKSIKLLPRLLNYFSFVFSSLIVGLSLRTYKIDIIVIESPPLFLGFSGIFLSWWLKAKMIFNVADLWPDSAVEIGAITNKKIIKFAGMIERYFYRKAFAITGQSPTIVKTIKERTLNKYVELITNGVDTELFSPDKKNNSIRKKYNATDKFLIIYAGLFGAAQGLGQILDAASLLKNDSNIMFLLVGDGPEKEYLVNRVNKEGLHNVKISPPVNKVEVPSILSSADLSIIALKTFIKGAVPSKIYEVMAVGLPVIFIGYGDAVEIINNAKAGLIVEPGDITKLVEKIHTLQHNFPLRKEMGGNGRKAVCQAYSRASIVKRFEKLLDIVKDGINVKEK